MKERRFHFLPLVALALMTAGCAGSEEIVDGGHDSDTNVTYATARQGAKASTRIDYEDGETMKAIWSANDAFSVFVGSALQTPRKFTIVAPAGGIYTANEKFSCNDFTANNGQTIDAIYPVLPDGSYNPYRLELDLASQTQGSDGDSKHLAAKDYIVGHATYSIGKDVDFDFTDTGNANAGRLGGILRLNITFPSEISNVNSITISTEGNTLNTKALVNLVGNTSVVYGTPQAITLTVTNGAVGADHLFKAFVMAFPSDISSKINVTAITNAGSYTSSYEPTTPIVLERGKRNTVNILSGTIDHSSHTAYNAVGTGTETDPYILYTAAQLADWAKQNNSGNIVIKNMVQGRSAGNVPAHFKLGNDFNLRSVDNFTPIGTADYPFNGYFDGNGKTIYYMAIHTTDNPYSGFIGRMTGGEVKNITMTEGSVTVNTSTTEKNFASGLVASFEGGTLSGILTSSVAVTVTSNGSVYAGGLVGAKKNEATVDTGATLSATGTVSATINDGTTGTNLEIGAGSVIGNGTKEENVKEGAGNVTATAPNGVKKVENGTSNGVDAGFILNPWKPISGGNLDTE